VKEMPHYGEKKAGGMSYRALGSETSALRPYLEGQDKESQSAIFKRNQDYYIASADKTIARLKLAKIRVKCSGISNEKYLLLIGKISNGLNWLEVLKDEIKGAASNQDLQAVISYKKWHAVKLIPRAVEGYAITEINGLKIKDINFPKHKLSHISELEKAKRHNKRAEEIFTDLLNLKECSDFSNAEKILLEGFEEVKTAHIIINSIPVHEKSY
jgi:hypothetical protein